MEFVKFPSLKEAGKEVFSYLKESVKCEGKIYLYPLTDTYGAVFCGEPADGELLPVVLAGRLIERGKPFLYLFTFKDMGKEHLSAVYYDGREIDGIIVFLQKRPVKSLILSYLVKKNKKVELYYYGDEKGYALLEEVLKEVGLEVGINRIRPNPITEKERKRLLREPNPFEFLKVFFSRFQGKSEGWFKKALAAVLIVLLGTAGFYGGKWAYLKYRKKSQVSRSKKEKPVFTAYDRNVSAWSVVEKLLRECRRAVVEYDGREVDVYGECGELKGGIPVQFENGKPAVYRYRIVPEKARGKGLPLKKVLEKALTYGASGTERDFYFTVSAPQNAEFVFRSAVPLKVRIVKDGNYTVEVRRK